MATEFIKLYNTILYIIKKIKNQHQGADIKRIFDEVASYNHTFSAYNQRFP